MEHESLGLGARVAPDGVTFCVWAPAASTVDVVVVHPEAATHPLVPLSGGYFAAHILDLTAGCRYRYRLDRTHTYPDPVSRFQPGGVHGASQVVDPGAYRWRDGDFHGVALDDLVIYELHVGTFTPEGTFDGVRSRLPYLAELGVTALELMPVADFPGERNWGYDGAALFAPSRAYGTPDALRRLVDAAHARGMAVILDVVYNHFGPDGAYAPLFGPYLREGTQTPWGTAINLDGPGSRGVRRFLRENAMAWLQEYHVDGLRLDATAALHDTSPVHFLTELGTSVARCAGPKRLLIAEDMRNLTRITAAPQDGGYGLSAQWSDDFHHAVHRMVTGESHAYFHDYQGNTSEIVRICRDGWLYRGAPSRFRNAPFGEAPRMVQPEQLVFYLQNHDQVGNRPHGDRLHHTIAHDLYHAVSVLLLLGPQCPLIFMGQEWAASTPFPFFTDHDPAIGQEVAAGRGREFVLTPGFSGDDIPHPQGENTFLAAKLCWEEHGAVPHKNSAALYRDVLQLRRRLGHPEAIEEASDSALVLRFDADVTLVVALAATQTPLPSGHVVWDSQRQAYAPDPAPPNIVASGVRFTRPGALLFGPAAC